MLWAAFGVMLLAALAAVLMPLYRAERALSARAIAVAVAVLAGSALLYQQIGQPDARFVPPGPPSVEDMVASLASRLEDDPDDLAGWKMLGRSYAVMRRYPEAIAAFERAVALEDSSDAQTLADLGEAVFLNDSRALTTRAGQLFENALAIAPGNPKALFYSGFAAAERGDRLLAASRWETLLATSPPPEIRGILEQRIAEWRGVSSAPAESPPPAETPAPDAGGTAPLTINVALGQSAGGAVDPAATVFIIARDPAQPSPPIAAVRRRAAELPSEVTLSDSDAMIPGRLLSGFDELEIVARASSSGQPIAQPGDWFGLGRIDTSKTRSLSIVIDQQVP